MTGNREEEEAQYKFLRIMGNNRMELCVSRRKRVCQATTAQFAPEASDIVIEESLALLNSLA